MNPLPLPVRLAAGLVATAVEQARDLPRLVIEFPVTAVSQALQASMRVQQRVTELAIKGDRALGALRPVEEKPSWATFDEDERSRANGVSTVTELRPAPRPPAPRVPAESPEPADVVPGWPASTRNGVSGTARTETDDLAPPRPATAGTATTDETTTGATTTGTDTGTGTPADEADAAPADGHGVATPDEPVDPARAAELVASAPVDHPAAEPADNEVLPGYATMSIAQLRGKLRTLSLDQLRALLAWERTHDDRPAYVTMLSNRITTVTEG